MIHTVTNQYDVLLVLGCGIDERGILSPDARTSVERAVGLFGQRTAPMLLFSGSFSYKADFVPPIGEAQAMKDYAIALGVPTDKILVEAGSKDTLGNVYFSKVNLFVPLGLHRIAVLRGPNHSVERLQFIFQKVLGDGYSYDFIQRAEIRPEEQEREREKSSLIVLKKWLDDIPDGDDASIYATMRKKHPGYSSDPRAMQNVRHDTM